MKGRVLVADDSTTVVEMMQAVLGARGHEVLTAEDGIQAAEAAFRCLPDLVVADVTMPGMNGYQLCRLLKNDPATAHIPVVLLTSRDQARDRFWGTKSGADHYLIKDGGLQAIAATLQQLLEEHSRLPRPAGREREAGLQTDIMYRVNEMLDQKLFEATVLNEVARSGHSSENFEQCADAVLSILGQFMDFDLLGVGLGGSEGRVEVAIRANRQVSKEVLDGFRQRLVESLSAAYGRQLAPEQLNISVNTPVCEGAVVTSLGNFRTHPLQGGGSTTGLLATAGGPQFSREEQRQFLSRMADQVFLVLDNARLYHKVRVLAVSDEQTGLFNLRHFRDRLSSEVARAARYHIPVSLIMLDVDHFKLANDRYGHPFGDLLLQQIAQILRQQIRDSDIAARYGGEEFTIILPATGLEAAREVAERLRASVEGAVLGDAEHAEHITISLGVATFPNSDVDDMDALVKAADAALYQAKAAGKNAVRTHQVREDART